MCVVSGPLLVTRLCVMMEGYYGGYRHWCPANNHTHTHTHTQLILLLTVHVSQPKLFNIYCKNLVKIMVLSTLFGPAIIVVNVIGSISTISITALATITGVRLGICSW